MRIKKLENGEMFIVASDDNENSSPYIVKTGSNGKKFVERNTVSASYLNISEGNSKTGEHVINFNNSIEYTCDHACECYKDGLCYAEGGCYAFAENQRRYSENVNFFVDSTSEEFIKAVQIAIDYFKFPLFRWFTCGDIINSRFFDCMAKVAKSNPQVKFWAYTKKYTIVNHWIDENGNLPENLTIIFSHWMNKDGTYFRVDNPYNLPTREFIPDGNENLIDGSFHVCPCSDPTVKATCETCDRPCYNLKSGEHMALCEHSTKQTKQRDKELKAAKAAL